MMKLLFLLVVLLAACGVHADEQLCGNPADIVFVLDESGSIWGPHFHMQLEFVATVIDEFDVEFNQTHIGVETFSSSPRVIFNLNDFHGASALKGNLLSVTQSRGGTRTDLALARMSGQMFKRNNARSWVPHIAIVITDGDSERPSLTTDAADSAKDDGITIMAVGVGSSVGLEELNAIASAPDLVFQVNNYNELAAELREILAIKACEVATLPPTTTTTTTTTTPKPTTTPPPQMIDGCYGGSPMDVVFAIPDQADAIETEYSLQFVRSIMEEFIIGPEQTHVAVTPRYCDDAEGIHLREYDNKEAFQLALERRQLAGTRLDWQLRYLAEEAYIPENGGRQDSEKFAVLVVDNHSEDTEQTIGWATVAKEDEDIHLIVIGVGGTESMQDEWRQVATSPSDFYAVNSYEELAVLRADLIRDLCDAISGLGIGRRQQRKSYRGLLESLKMKLKRRGQ